MRMQIRLAIVGALGVAGCFTPYTHSLSPVISLKAVERPAEAKERWGEQLLVTQEDSGVTKFSFEDRMIRAVFVVRRTDVVMDLTNKTEHSLRLLWSETTMVLPEGSPSPVMMNGWRYSECRAEKPPAVVPKGVTISDVIVPCARVALGYSTWEENDIFPRDAYFAYDTSVVRVEAAIRGQLVGKELALLLPLQIEGVTNEYTFRFAIDSILVRRIRP